MQPLRLCYVGWGDHVHLERWAGYFAKQGHRVTVITVSGRGNYPPNVTQIELGSHGRGLAWKRLHLAYLLWRLKPDLVHVHWAHFASLLTDRWNGPIIVTAWGSDIYRPDEFSSVEMRRLATSLRRAAAITCDSDDLADRIRSLTDEKIDVAVVQWGVDTDTFYPGAADPAFRESLIGLDRPVVLSIRNFTPLYNLETVVSAFARVLQEVPEAMLVMKKYGNPQPDYTGIITSRIAELGIGQAVRIVDDLPYERMPDLYRMAQVTVSVPLSDATPMSMLEAMACGSVPIYTDLPSLREWIRDGYNGYLVSPADVDLLSKRIVKVLRSAALRQDFARQNLSIVRTRGSQAASMSRMEAIYAELAARDRSASRLGRRQTIAGG